MTDPIREAFKKAKLDISNLKSQIYQQQKEIEELKRTLSSQSSRQTDKPTDRHIIAPKTLEPQEIQTHSIENQTNPSQYQTDIPVYEKNYPLEALKSPISSISSGNRGVQTDRQTNQQTDRQIELNEHFAPLAQETDKIQELQKVTEILSSLDEVKKSLRQTFKRLSNQELAVFTTIYQLENQGLTVDYSLISEHLSLSESAIRDYVQKLIKKQVPLQKTKENNKKIILSIPLSLKKIASINTILELRNL